MVLFFMQFRGWNMTEFILKYWVQVGMGLLVAFIGWCTKNTRKIVQREFINYSALASGVQALLRDRLIQSYNYHIQKGYCAVHDKDNVKNIYDKYHLLGANGVVDGLMDMFMNLPTVESSKHTSSAKDIAGYIKDNK